MTKQGLLTLNIPRLFDTMCYTKFTLGGISLYTTGVTMRDKMVELIKPPISTMAKGDINGFVDKAIGNNPPIAVKDVSTIGRKRTSPASRIASSTDLPC